MVSTKAHSPDLGSQNLQYKMKLSKDSKCGVCEDHEESIEHLFVECNKSKVLWLTLHIDIVNNIFKLVIVNNEVLHFLSAKYKNPLYYNAYKRLTKRIYEEQQYLSLISGKNAVF